MSEEVTAARFREIASNIADFEKALKGSTCFVEFYTADDLFGKHIFERITYSEVAALFQVAAAALDARRTGK